MHKARLAKIDHARHCIERDLIVKWKDGSSVSAKHLTYCWKENKVILFIFITVKAVEENRVYVWIIINGEILFRKKLWMAFTDFISSFSKEVGEILIKFTDSASFGVIINTEEYFSVVQKEMRHGPED